MKRATDKFISDKSFLILHIERIELHVDNLEKKLFDLRKNEQQFSHAYYNLKDRLRSSQEVLKQLKEQHNDDRSS
jgi:hypothetical protein